MGIPATRGLAHPPGIFANGCGFDLRTRKYLPGIFVLYYFIINTYILHKKRVENAQVPAVPAHPLTRGIRHSRHPHPAGITPGGCGCALSDAKIPGELVPAGAGTNSCTSLTGGHRPSGERQRSSECYDTIGTECSLNGRFF